MKSKFTNIPKVSVYIIGCFPVVLVFACEYIFHSSCFYEEANGNALVVVAAVRFHISLPLATPGLGLSYVSSLIAFAALPPPLLTYHASLLRINPCLIVVFGATDVTLVQQSFTILGVCLSKTFKEISIQLGQNVYTAS